MTQLLAKMQRLAVEAQEHATRKAKAEADDADAMSRMSETLRALILEEQQHKTSKAKIEEETAEMIQRWTAQCIQNDRNPIAN